MNLRKFFVGLLSVFFAIQAFGQLPIFPGVKTPATAAAPFGPNNIAHVSGNDGSVQNGNTQSLGKAMPQNVVNGNSVIVCVTIFNFGTTDGPFTAAMLTKTAGTATVGTIVLDKFSGWVHNASFGVAIYRVPITGAGSLTVTFNSGGTSSQIWLSVSEFSGFNASPFDSGSSGVNSGTSTGSTLGTGETTGTVNSTVSGVIIYVATEGGSANWTRSVSDSLIANDSNGSTDQTGCSQYRLITATPSTLQSTVQGTGIGWNNCWVGYKSS